MFYYFLGTAFTIWMAVETVRRGQTMPWLWICLFFGPLGSAIYFFTHYLGQVLPANRGSAPATSKAQLNMLGAEATRLDKPEVWADYATALHERKKYAEAAKAAEKAVAKDPDHHKALYELGRNRLELGLAQAAIEPLAKVVQHDEYLDMGGALYALAKAQQQSGDEQAALTSLERLTERSSRPLFLYNLATLQWRCGQKEASRRSLQTIIDDAELVPSYAQREMKPWVKKARKALQKFS